MSVPDARGEPRLRARGLTKIYSVPVLEEVDFELRHGEIHALLGANGAGKSTLCRILAGLTDPTQGSMTLDGHSYAPQNKGAAERAGVQIVQQELNLIPTLSVAENLFLNRLPSRWTVIDRRVLRERARRALERLGLNDISAREPVENLGVGRQQLVEIASALDRDCRVLILDEPTAALSAAETDRLFEQLDQLRRAGVGIIFISHRLDEVTRLADRVTVLRDGRRVGTRATDGLSTNRMVSMMTGEQAGVRSATETKNDGDPPENPARIAGRAANGDCPARPVLRVENLSRPPHFQDVSFSVVGGQRLGIYGLVGSGRTELLRAIFGADVAQSGAVYLGDDPAPHRFTHPRQAVARRIAMVTEDRKQNGLLLSQPVRVNTTLCSMERCSSPRLGLIRPAVERANANAMVDELDTRCRGIEQTVSELSGGNQQKVVIAKWLARDADVYLFDEPARGIDLAARQRIFRLFEMLAAGGKALVIVSSDLDELMQTCNDIAVMSAGQLVAVLDRDEWSHEKIMQTAFSGYLQSAGGGLS